MTINYKTHENNGDFTEYFYLFRKAFPNSKQLICMNEKYQDYLNWLYEKNPLGSVVGFDAFCNNELVGHYACVPINWKLGTKSYKSLLSLNTAVDPKFHGQGIFSEMARNTYDLARTLGYDFVYGVSNQNSTPGFRKLGFKVLGPLKLQISLPWFNKLKSLDTKSEYLSNHLTSEVLNWRLNRPFTTYLQKGPRIISTSQMLPISIISKETRYLSPKPSLNYKYQSPFSLYIGTKKQNGFITLPKWARPVPLNLIVKNLNYKGELFYSIGNWNLDFLDFDLA